MPNRTPNQDIIEEVLSLAQEAERRDLLIRLLGASAIHLHCPEFRHFYETFGRKISDIDFISYSRFNHRVEPFFKEMGYVGRDRFNAIHGNSRLIFDDESNGRYVDVFFNELQMSHTVSFEGRLELDQPTICLADLFLEKTQIAKINEKDIKDMIILLREHDVGEQNRETIDVRYIAKQLAHDWGYWFTAFTNIQRIRDAVKLHDQLPEKDKRIVLAKLDEIRRIVDSEPKSTKWKMRSKLGTKGKWYRDVEEARL